jgi:DNA-binding MarR family transcriptional regulator
MLRTEWRVLFHLGRYGAMSAREISRRAGIHKTKVSRAVAALERKRFLERRDSAGGSAGRDPVAAIRPDGRPSPT